MKDSEFYTRKEENNFDEFKEYKAEEYYKIEANKLSTPEEIFTGVEDSVVSEPAKREAEVRNNDKVEEFKDTKDIVDKASKINNLGDVTKKVLNIPGTIATTAATTVVGATVAVIGFTGIVATKPNITIRDINIGTDYIEYKLDAYDLNPDERYIVKVGNPNYSFNYELEPGENNFFVKDLSPNQTYTIEVSSSLNEFGTSVSYFSYSFYTLRKGDTEIIFSFNEYPNEIVGENLDFEVYISNPDTSTTYYLEYFGEMSENFGEHVFDDSYQYSNTLTSIVPDMYLFMISKDIVKEDGSIEREIIKEEKYHLEYSLIESSSVELIKDDDDKRFSIPYKFNFKNSDYYYYLNFYNNNYDVVYSDDSTNGVIEGIFDNVEEGFITLEVYIKDNEGNDFVIFSDYFDVVYPEDWKEEELVYSATTTYNFDYHEFSVDCFMTDYDDSFNVYCKIDQYNDNIMLINSSSDINTYFEYDYDKYKAHLSEELVEGSRYISFSFYYYNSNNEEVVLDYLNFIYIDNIYTDYKMYIDYNDDLFSVYYDSTGNPTIYATLNLMELNDYNCYSVYVNGIRFEDKTIYSTDIEYQFDSNIDLVTIEVENYSIFKGEYVFEEKYKLAEYKLARPEFDVSLTEEQGAYYLDINVENDPNVIKEYNECKISVYQDTSFIFELSFDDLINGTGNSLHINLNQYLNVYSPIRVEIRSVFYSFEFNTSIAYEFVSEELEFTDFVTTNVNSLEVVGPNIHIEGTSDIESLDPDGQMQLSIIQYDAALNEIRTVEEIEYSQNNFSGNDMINKDTKSFVVVLEYRLSDNTTIELYQSDKYNVDDLSVYDEEYSKQSLLITGTKNNDTYNFNAVLDGYEEMDYIKYHYKFTYYDELDSILSETENLDNFDGDYFYLTVTPYVMYKDGNVDCSTIIRSDNYEFTDPSLEILERKLIGPSNLGVMYSFKYEIMNPNTSIEIGTINIMYTDDIGNTNSIELDTSSSEFIIDVNSNTSFTITPVFKVKHVLIDELYDISNPPVNYTVDSEFNISEYYFNTQSDVFVINSDSFLKSNEIAVVIVDSQVTEITYYQQEIPILFGNDMSKSITIGVRDKDTGNMVDWFTPINLVIEKISNIEYTMGAPNPGDYTVTYNADGTINFYAESGFNCLDDRVYYEVHYNENVFRSTDSLIRIEDVPMNNYYLKYKVCLDIDGLKYVIGETTPSGGIEFTNYYIDATARIGDSGIVLELSNYLHIENTFTVFILGEEKTYNYTPNNTTNYLTYNIDCSDPSIVEKIVLTVSIANYYGDYDGLSTKYTLKGNVYTNVSYELEII